MRKLSFLLAAALLSASPLSAAPVPASAFLIRVDVSEQKMQLIRDGRVDTVYPVSTSKYGIGNKLLSGKTPLGKHYVAKKIGDGLPSRAVLKNRVPTGERAKVNRTKEPRAADTITSRILWLRGREPGKNKGKGVDSFHRMIYIHGTPDEGLIGQPASHGCIRMKNEDVIELFDRVPVGTPVEIVE